MHRKPEKKQKNEKALKNHNTECEFSLNALQFLRYYAI